MNARVFLLILVTGSFMAIWNSDHEAMQAALAKRQQLASSEVAVHAPEGDLLKTSAELFSHDETEWQAYLDATRALEVTTQDVEDAEEVEVIELKAASEHLKSMTVAPHFEPQIQVVAPEDFSLAVPVRDSIRSEEPRLTLAPQSRFELRHAAAHLVSPVLASIEDAIDEYGELEGSVETQSGSNPEADNAESSNEPVSQIATAEEVHSSRNESLKAVMTRSDENASNSPENIQPVLPLEGPTIPLPANLTDGTWQVVDAAGRSFKITIDRRSAKYAGAKINSSDADVELEEHFCIRTSTTGERWCFIRSYETASAAKRIATEFFSPTQTMPDRQ